MSKKLEWNFQSLEQKVEYLLKFVKIYERAPRAIEELDGDLVGSFWKNIKNSVKNRRYIDLRNKLIQENTILLEDYNYYK